MVIQIFTLAFIIMLGEQSKDKIPIFNNDRVSNSWLIDKPGNTPDNGVDPAVAFVVLAIRTTPLVESMVSNVAVVKLELASCRSIVIIIDMFFKMLGV